MAEIKQIIKKYIPEWLIKLLRPYYHGAVASLASIFFGQPANKMIVIGVTGTAGKSTTIAMLSAILNFVHRKCGYITTVEFFDGDHHQLNQHGLSMPGGFLLQKQLKAMQKNGCKFAILECTSEGLAQNRHYGINFDAALLTNISPAHLDVHGGFELYKKAKLKLFARMLQLPKKAGKVKKMIGVNLDNLQAVEFLAFPAEVKFGISLHPHPQMGELQVYGAEHIKLNEGLNFEVRGAEFQLKLIGEFNVYNALMAAACANILGVTLPNCAAALAKFTEPAGRMEEINSGRGFRIFVDYAPEPAGMQAALLALSAQPHKRLIHVFGATGGHRDVAKRFEFGKISAGFADYLIITNDDVYDSDPKKVARDIVAGINRLKNKEFQMKHYEVILDRRQAIAHALSIARVGDIILFTGKGSEQFLVLPGNHRVVWDEREVVREEIKKLSKT